MVDKKGWSAVVFGLFIILIAFGGIIYWQFVFNKMVPVTDQQPVEKTVPSEEVVVVSPEIFLSLETTASGTVKAGEPLEIAVIVRAPDKKVVGADLVLSYDPQELTINQVQKGNFFTSPALFKTDLDENGKAIISIGSLSAESGEGSLVSLVVTPEIEGEIGLSFDPQTIVALLNSEKQANVEITNLIISAVGENE